MFALFTNTEVNYCFSIYYNKTKMTEKQRKYSKNNLYFTQLPYTVVVNKTAFACFSNFIH
jgi:hypothetical protein